MSLSAAQYATLKADILADPVLKAYPNNADGNGAIEAAYLLTAAPSFTVWKSNVLIAETGQAFNGGEWAGMTGTNHTRLQTVAQYLGQGYNPTQSDVRQMFNDIWSGAGGQFTRANLLILWKRLANRGEKLFANTALGNGADATPATLVIEGGISSSDIAFARNS